MNEVNRNKPGLFQQTLLDKAISYIDPVRGAQRMKARGMMALTGGYNSGDRGRRPNRGWGTSSGSADAEILPYLDKIRSDSNDLMRKAPLALGAVNTVVTNVVGTGLKPESAPDVQVLRDLAKLSDENIQLFQDQAEREFKIWSQSTCCDASRSQIFTGIQDLALRSTLVSGDIFVIRRMIKRPGARLQTALQLIEADRVDNPKKVADTALLAGGVKRDQYGAATAYCILKAHPGDTFLSKDKFITEEYPAFLKNGEWNVLHLMTKLRPEQTRGVPYLAPVIEALKQLSRYTEAEIDAAVISSFFTVFVKTDGGQGLPGSTDGSSAADDEVKMGTGSIVDLGPNESIETANPGRPNPAFDPFILAVLRQVGVALELPFEVLVKHFTASYSAAQAALLEAWKFFKARRVWLSDRLCTPVWEAVISEAVAEGHIIAPGFFSDPLIRAAYLGVRWTGDPRGSIDPTKEVSANEIMEDRGWKTAQQITAEMTGGDWDSNFERRVEEQKKRKEGGLMLTTQANISQSAPGVSGGSSPSDTADSTDPLTPADPAAQ